jgi:hypothetical protein
MKKPPRGGAVRQPNLTLTIPTSDREHRTLRDWLTASQQTWQALVVAGAWRPHRVSRAAQQLWPGRLRTWCPKRRSYLYSWPELQEIAAQLGQEKWR